MNNESEHAAGKETALQEFLKSFRIALNFISLYHKNHKSFIAALTDLKSQADRILALSSPMTIMFSADALSVDGTVFGKKQVYFDLAKQFHFRKVKSLQLSAGITIEELSAVMELACLPVKDLLAKGGMQYLLSQAHIVNARVEELDYSLLLQNEGGVEADLGVYLLNQSMQGRDPARIREFAHHFDSAIANISVGNIAVDAQLRGNLHSFLAYLRTSDEGEFHKCVTSLLRVALKDKADATPEQMAAFVEFAGPLSPDAVAGIIVGEASRNDEFNSKNLALFLQARSAQDQGAVHVSLARNISARDPSTRISSKASKKLKELFSVSDTPLVSGMYEQVMQTLSGNIQAQAPLRFDRDRARQNYRSILLFSLGFEQDPRRIDTIAHRINSEWQDFIQDPVPEYFTALGAALSDRRGQAAEIHSLGELDLLYRRFIEDAAFGSEVPAWLGGLIDGLQESTRDERWYFEKIFASGVVTRRGLSLFLRLFPEHTGRLCEYLARAADDLELIGSVVDALKGIDSTRVNEILENIYGFSNDLIKIEVLRAMAGLSEPDERFLLPLVSQENALLRKEAMAVCASDTGMRDKAAEILLRDDDMWGRKNALLEENIGIIEELRVAAAIPYLERLVKKPFFWNSSVRRRAQKAIEALA